MAPTRHCARCGGQNPTEARFCIECGAGLESAATGPTVKLSGVNCAACGALNPERSQFCCMCGRGLAQPQARGGTLPLPGRQARSRPHLPSGPPPQHQRSYPRVHWPPIPAPIPPAPLRQPQPPHSPLHSPAAIPLLVIFGLACLLMFKALGPVVLLFALLALVASVTSAQRVSSLVLNIVLLVIGMVVVATTGFWPALFVLFWVSRHR
ncbi:MAG TPA: zinc ribbon domain-containing protein [Roseiflexaceae bacterium]|nr:zinc ribbon domain-containing protein [Roseiflexaceae bacterium]